MAAKGDSRSGGLDGSSGGRDISDCRIGECEKESSGGGGGKTKFGGKKHEGLKKFEKRDWK